MLLRRLRLLRSIQIFPIVLGLDLHKAAELKKQGNAAYAQNDIEAGTLRKLAAFS